ncbi:MAG: hypothetical protein HRT61_00960 [Ekhidna sp.]|nr:hypothetical protein [Ekhidna sp.]
MKQYLNYRRVNGNLTIIYDDGTTDHITRENPKFERVSKALKNQDYVTLNEVLQETDNRPSFEAAGVEIREDGVYYQNKKLEGVAAEYLLQQYNDNYPIDGLPQFIAKLEQNPSSRVREQLFTFLLKGNNAFDADGDFYAYKRVRDTYRDCHSGTMDNSPGRIVEMPRRDVDDDPNRTCSRGLHVCSYDYLDSFYGSRILKIKVNPADVVSVPNDYNHTKMRTCRYEVLEDITDQATQADVLSKSEEEILTFEKLGLEEYDSVYHTFHEYGEVTSINIHDETLEIVFDESVVRYTFTEFLDAYKRDEIDIA